MSDIPEAKPKNLTATYAAGQQPHAEQPAQQCNHCNGSGRMVRDQDHGTDQECFVCEGRGAVEPDQPAQQEPVAAECKFDSESEWGRCSVEHHNLVQSEPHNWPGYQTRLLYTTPQAPPQRQPLTDEQSRELFAAFVKKNLGDIAVMDGGRYISHKINNYWLVWQAAHGITKGEA